MELNTSSSYCFEILPSLLEGLYKNIYSSRNVDPIEESEKIWEMQ